MHRLLMALLLATLFGCRSEPDAPADAGEVFDGGFAEFDLTTRQHLPEDVPPEIVRDPSTSEEQLRLRFRAPPRSEVYPRTVSELTLTTPTAQGTYDCGGPTRLILTETNVGMGAGAPTTSKTYDTSGDGGTCSVTLTEFSTTHGGVIRGSFSGTLPHVSSEEPLPGALGPPVELSNGTFETRYRTER